MTKLLRRLESVLSKVSGNTVTMYDDEKYDEYWCDLGKHRVYEDAYNHKYHCCFSCYYRED